MHTTFGQSIKSQIAAIALTILASTTLLIGAVGPATPLANQATHSVRTVA
jgi:hypothetical protein